MHDGNIVTRGAIISFPMGKLLWCYSSRSMNLTWKLIENNTCS
jgi:hypothetical protein